MRYWRPSGPGHPTEIQIMPHSFRLHLSYTSFSAPCLLQLLKDGMVPCRKAALLPSTMTQQCMCVPVRSRPRSLSQLLRHPSRTPPPLFRPTPPTRTPTPTRPRSTAAVTGHTLLPKVATIQIPTMASPPPPPPPPPPAAVPAALAGDDNDDYKWTNMRTVSMSLTNETLCYRLE